MGQLKKKALIEGVEMFTYIVSSAFGLEKMTKTELTRLGYEITSVENGSIEVRAGIEALADLNINLRTAERVFLKLGEFGAKSFDELGDGIYALPWEDYLSESGKFIINAKSVKSALFSKSDIQRVSKKMLCKKLSEDYGTLIFPENGESYSIHVNILNDKVSVLMDSSGQGLHKRAYRTTQGEAPIKETLAASMVLLSDWRFKNSLIDPFCGSGTIVIEAAMIARNIAPGLLRKFAAEEWIFVPEDLFESFRERARAAIRKEASFDIRATDIDERAIQMARENAKRAGVLDTIDFRVEDIKDLKLDEPSSIVTNPPYGLRLSEQEEALELYKILGLKVAANSSTSCYAISAAENFEEAFGKKADKKRKLFNGNLKCNLYQYLAKRTKRQ